GEADCFSDVTEFFLMEKNHLCLQIGIKLGLLHTNLRATIVVASEKSGGKIKGGITIHHQAVNASERVTFRIFDLDICAVLNRLTKGQRIIQVPPFALKNSVTHQCN